MKRSHYFPWMGLIPLALGGCYVYSTAIPVVGTLLFTLLPWLMVLTWAWLGMDCGRQRRPFWLSLLAGHWGVLLSVLCGAWQFWLVDDAARSIPIALFGQFISGVVPGAMMLVTPLCIVDGTYMGSLEHFDIILCISGSHRVLNRDFKIVAHPADSFSLGYRLWYNLKISGIGEKASHGVRISLKNFLLKFL